VTTQSPLKERAILVDFDGGFYEWHRRDRKVERSVAATAGVRPDVGRYIKNIFYGRDQTLVAIRRVVQDTRAASHDMTMPWNPGQRLLLNLNFINHKRLITDANNRLEELTEQLEDEWDDMIRDAETNLGSLHVAENYPTLLQVKRNIYVRATPFPLSDHHDVRLEADEEFVDEIRKEVMANQAKLYSDAVYSAWERLYDVIANAHANVNKQRHRNERFRDEWVDRIKALAPILKGLNIDGDARLDEMADRIKDLSWVIDESGGSCRPRSQAVKNRVNDIYDTLSAIYRPMQAEREEAASV